MKHASTMSPLGALRAFFTALAVVMASIPAAQAQTPATWPSRPIRLINPCLLYTSDAADE